MSTQTKLPQQDERSAKAGDVANSVSEGLSAVDPNKRRRSNCLSYLSRSLADKEYETRRVKELLAIHEHRYHNLFRQYTELLRTVRVGSLCPSCGRAADSDDPSGKLSTDCDEAGGSRGRRPNRLFSFGEVSEKNFDRLVEENAKLKLAIRKIKDEEGVDVRRVIEVQDYETIIDSLREDIWRLKLELQEVRYINSMLTKKDKSYLLEKNEQLQKRVSLLERSVRNKDDMIEQLMNVLRKRESQPDGGVSCAVSSSQSPVGEDKTSVKDEHQRNETIQAYKDKISQIMELKLSLAREVEEKTNLNKKYEDVLSFLKSLLAQRLREPVECPESVHQLVNEKKSLQEAVNVLQHDLQKVLAEKQLLVEQCKTLQEDFDQERKKNEKVTQELQREIKRLKAKSTLSAQGSFSSEVTHDSGFSSAGSHISSQSSVKTGELICNRCEQSFHQNDRKRFDEHKRKCEAD